MGVERLIELEDQEVCSEIDFPSNNRIYTHKASCILQLIYKLNKDTKNAANWIGKSPWGFNSMKELQMTGKPESREENIIACQVSNDQLWEHTYK